MTSLLLLLTLVLTPQTGRRPDDEELKRLSRRADVVVVVEVKKVEPTSEPQPWSGLTSSWQFVRYEVKDVLKGEFPTGEVKVGFILVKNSLTADKSRPALSPELFREHNVHIVFLDLDRLVPEMGTRYAGVSQDYGAIMFTPEAAAAVRALSAESKGGEEGKGP